MVAGETIHKSTAKLESTSSGAAKFGAVGGYILLLIGFVLLTFVFAARSGSGKKTALFVLAFGIIASVFAGSWGRRKEKAGSPSPVESVSNVILSLCLIAYLTIVPFSQPSFCCKYSGMFAALIIIVSNAYLLPRDRQACNADSPAYPLILLSLLMVVIVNAMHQADILGSLTPDESLDIPDLELLRDFINASTEPMVTLGGQPQDMEPIFENIEVMQ